MARVQFVHPDGSVEEVEGQDGQSIMKLALSNLVDGIVGECGGDLSCATCHVFVDEAWAGKFPPRTTEEEDMLDVTTEEPTDYSRLSCQLKCSADVDGVIVRLPRTQR